MRSGPGDTLCSRSPLPFAGPNPVRFKGLPAVQAGSQPVAPLASSCRADDVQLARSGGAIHERLAGTTQAWYVHHQESVKGRKKPLLPTMRPLYPHGPRPLPIVMERGGGLIVLPLSAPERGPGGEVAL